MAVSVSVASYTEHIVAFTYRVIEYGGGVLTAESYNTENKIMVGSIMIFEAESIEAVRQTIERDEFFTANIVSPDRFIYKQTGAKSASSVGYRQD